MQSVVEKEQIEMFAEMTRSQIFGTVPFQISLQQLSGL